MSAEHIGGLAKRVPIEGTANAYVKSEVQALARELKRERKQRLKGRA